MLQSHLSYSRAGSQLSSFRTMANMNICIFKGLICDDEVDFDATWATLSSSLREIHTKNASSLSFEQLYRNAYKLVLKKKGEALYEAVKNFEADWLIHNVHPQILESLPSEYTTGSATSVNEKRVIGERLMRALKHAWEDHNTSMNMTADVLMYMVRILGFLV